MGVGVPVPAPAEVPGRGQGGVGRFVAGESFLSDFPVLLTATEASALLEDAADVHPTGVRPMAGT
ncbi:MAG TPA: hypothetical protein VK054_03150, partial [Beutenbergiaceae bacterium]|nr:hypothetical protein [Beutenbergiaceae bacterium]